MNVAIKWHEDMWQEIKDAALFTIHKTKGKYPDENWKKKILMAEHSPIRTGRLIIDIYDIPSFVATHFVRHHIGIEKYVSTYRNDRVDYDEIPNRLTPVNMKIDIDFQAFINISRKRYCYQASKETRLVWIAIMSKVNEVEPELYWACTPECIYRCGCPEMFKCEERYFAEFLKFVGNENFAKLFNVETRYDYYHEFVLQNEKEKGDKK